MQKLLLASVVCLGSTIRAIEISDKDKFLGLPIKATPSVGAVQPEDEEMFSQTAHPCTFKLGSGIYDFTPYKFASNSTPVPAVWEYWNLTDPADPLTLNIEVYTWNYTWC